MDLNKLVEQCNKSIIDEFDDFISNNMLVLSPTALVEAEKVRNSMVNYVKASDIYCNKFFALEAYGVQDWEGYQQAIDSIY